MKLVDPISTVLGQKGRAVWSLRPDASVYEAIEMMADKRIGALKRPFVRKVCGRRGLSVGN